MLLVYKIFFGGSIPRNRRKINEKTTENVINFVGLTVGPILCAWLFCFFFLSHFRLEILAKTVIREIQILKISKRGNQILKISKRRNLSKIGSGKPKKRKRFPIEGGYY